MSRGISTKQMHEGPWLDRLFPVHVPGGRMVSVVRFSVLPSNLGVLEGGLSPDANAVQREKIVSLAKTFGEPVVVLEPKSRAFPRISTERYPRERYPWMACIARLTSEPLVPNSTAASSELTLVWWQDAFDAPLPMEIERAAAALDWRRSARDVESF